MQRSLSIMLIEDNDDHAALISRHLLNCFDHKLKMSLSRANRVAIAVEQLAQNDFDVVLCDLQLPDSTIDETLPAVLAAAGNAPVVVLTSLNDAEAGAAMVQQGAQDFLVKSTITGPLITRSLLYSIERKRLERQQKAHAVELERKVAERTQYLEVLLSTSDISDKSHSVYEALRRTVNEIYRAFDMDTGIAVLLMDQPLSGAPDEVVIFQTPSATSNDQTGLGISEQRWTALKTAVERRQVVTDESSELAIVVVPVVVGTSVPALMEFQCRCLPDDRESLISVLERIGTQIGRVFERNDFQRAIEEAGLVEQQRLTSELHDGLGHELSGLAFLANSLVLQMEEADSEFVSVADDVRSGIRNGLRMLRQTLRGLTAVQLGDDGLIPAMASLLADAERRFGIHCLFECENPEIQLSELASAQVYRIVQEALTNACKHSGGTCICVILIAHERALTITVADDGQGIAQTEAVDKGLGLGIMRYRARLIGGHVEVRSVRNIGAQVILEVPFSRAS